MGHACLEYEHIHCRPVKLLSDILFLDWLAQLTWLCLHRRHISYKNLALLHCVNIYYKNASLGCGHTEMAFSKPHPTLNAGCFD